MKSKKIGLMIAFIAIIIVSLLVKQQQNETKINHGEISIELNKRFMIESDNDEFYIHIPINENILDLEVIVKDNNEIVDALEIHDFIISIDTFVPVEQSKEFEVSNKKIVIHVIVQ